MAEEKMNHFLISGLVAARDKQPYVQLLINGEMMFQWNVTEARSIAWDMLRMCSRVEADAMIFNFFNKLGIPEQALAAFMQDFRDYRHELDMMPVDRADFNVEEEGGGRVDDGA